MNYSRKGFQRTNNNNSYQSKMINSKRSPFWKEQKMRDPLWLHKFNFSQQFEVIGFQFMSLEVRPKIFIENI